MSTSNLDQADLRAVALGGTISEDVLKTVWDISKIPLPMTDLISTDDVGNHYSSWLINKLAAADKDNANVDGADAGADDSVTGARVGNFTQIPDKVVKVGTAARASDSIAYADELADQVERRQQELKRDTEQSLVSLNGSQEDNGDDEPGKSAGLEAWLTSNTFRGGTGADGGFGTTTPGVIDPATPGIKRALTETLLKDAMEAVYDAGGEISVMMMRPKVKRLMSEYFYTDEAKTATMQTDVGQEKMADVAKGNVEYWHSDYGSVVFVPNRIQAATAASHSTVFLIDPDYLRIGYMWGPRVDELAKTGLADNRQMSQSFTLKCLNEEAHALVADIDEAVPMVA